MPKLTEVGLVGKEHSLATVIETLSVAKGLASGNRVSPFDGDVLFIVNFTVSVYVPATGKGDPEKAGMHK